MCASRKSTMVVTKQGWRWAVLAAVTLGTMIADTPLMVTGVYLVEWRKHLQCTMAEISIIASMVSLWYHVGGLSGMWVNRLGYRAVVFLGGVAGFVAFVLSAFASTRLSLCLIYGVLTSFLAGSTFAGYHVALASYFDKNFSTVRGIAAAGPGVAVMALPPLAQYLIDTYGWQGSILIFAAIFGNVAVSGVVLRPESVWASDWGVVASRRLKAVRACGDGTRHYQPALSEEGDVMLSGGDEAVKSSELIPGKEAIRMQTMDQSLSDCVKSDLATQSHGVVQQPEGTSFVTADQSDVCVSSVDSECGKPVDSLGNDADTMRSHDAGTVESAGKLPSDSSDVVRAVSLILSSSSGGRCRRACNVVGLPLLTHCYRFYLVLISQLTFSMCLIAVMSHLPASVVYRGTDPQAAAFLMSFFGIGSIVGRLVHGVIIDLGWLSASSVNAISMIGFGLSAIVFRLAASYWLWAAACVVAGLTSGAVNSLTVVLTRIYVGKVHMGSALGISQQAHGIGGSMGALLGGVLYDVTKTYNYTFYLFGGILAVSGLIFLLEPTLGRMESEKAKRILEEERLSKGNEPVTL